MNHENQQHNALAFSAYYSSLAGAWQNTKTFPAWMRFNAIQMAENNALVTLAYALGVSVSEARVIVASR